jgi:hypothetical protein
MTWYDYGSIDPIDDVGSVTCTGNTNGDWGRSISNLTLFNDRIYLGYGDYTCNNPTGGCYLLGWDIASGQVVNHGLLNTHAILDNIVAGSQLAVPYTDTAVGEKPAAAFLHTDGTLELLPTDGEGPSAAHAYGAVVFGGKRYLSGSHYLSGHDTCRAVWRDDSGRWTQWDGGNPLFTPNSYEETVASGPFRMYALFVIGSTLYAGGSNGVIKKTTTGALGSWTNAMTGAVTRPKKGLVIGSTAYYRSEEPGYVTGGLYSFNGSAQTTIVGSGIWDHTVGTDGNLYYLDSSMNIKNLAGSTVETAPANSRSIAYINGVWYAGTKDSHLHATTPAPKIVVDNSANLVVDSSGNYVTYS